MLAEQIKMALRAYFVVFKAKINACSPQNTLFQL